MATRKQTRLTGALSTLKQAQIKLAKLQHDGLIDRRETDAVIDATKEACLLAHRALMAEYSPEERPARS